VIRAGHSKAKRCSISLLLGGFAAVSMAVALFAGPSHAADADSVATPAPAPAPAPAATSPPVSTPIAPVPTTEATLKPVIAAVDPWAEGMTWASFRFGYAKSAAQFAANGNVGFGFAYTKFLSRKWSLGGSAQYDVLGKFGDASEIEIPFGVDLTRHFKWATTARPYFGLGSGLFFHKTYRTGEDVGDIRKGVFLTYGVNAPISDQSLIGLDVRNTFEFDAESHNPVFVNDQKSAMHWSVKLNYARFF